MIDITRKDRYRLDFPALMAQCEENYGRLQRLLALLGEGEDALALVLSAGERERAVRLEVLERCPYTTMLRLVMAAPHGHLPDTALEVRMYHDARSAEVIGMSSHQRARARYPYPNAMMHQQDEKHQWNRFLADWLGHIQRQAHRADPVWQPAAG